MPSTEILYGGGLATLLIGIISALLYWNFVKTYDFWKKRKVPFVRPTPFVGSAIDYVIKSIQETELQRYRKLGRIYGHFEGTLPLLSVGEPTLLKSILVKDFQVFPSSRLPNFNDELVSKMLANAKGEDWRRIRSIISPTFSSGKIKKVLDIMKDCSRTAVENFKAETKNEIPVNTKRIYGAFTMDLIASAAFSTKIDSHNDPDNEFASTAKKAFRRDFTWKNLVLLVCPQLRTLLRIPGFQPFAFDFFHDVSLKIIEERKRTGERGNDFLQLLMDTAKELSEDPNSEFKEKDNEDIAVYGGVSTDHQVFKNVSKKHLSVTEVIAQCITFFFAGYESVSTALSMATYMLALHPEVQDKVYADLVKAVEEDNGELTYDGLQSVKYLDNIISETLRLFPPILRTERQAVADYKLGDTGITIPKGTVITVPIYAMHRDPDFFPDPEKFDPDRFSAEERSKRDPYAYLPFGAGPRNCVAMRFALVEIKVCLAYVILHFKIKRCQETKVPMEYFRGVGLLQPKDVTVALEERKENPLINKN
ncbi:unnamed protein product [Larinioides sclopetarius]|uniref:Cytochrome P450 n=1 Tax=Larinioides sclopetarius TaxID=280406 RepID=A0AAV2AVW6_9ARAC